MAQPVKAGLTTETIRYVTKTEFATFILIFAEWLSLKGAEFNLAWENH